MRFLEVTAGLLMTLMLYTTWPPNEEHIDVVVSYIADVGAPGMHVYLIAGIDKHARGFFQAGDRGRWRLVIGRSVTLADERRIFMRYYPEGHSKFGRPEWLGPKVPPDVSYRIAIDIHADGQVTHRHCIKPCKLSNSVSKNSP